MKRFYFVKKSLIRLFSVLIISIMMLNNVVLYYFGSCTSEVDQNENPQLLNQVLSSTAESSCTKINFKPLPESYSASFYSYEYCRKKLTIHQKYLTILSETHSEPNIRHSSFQLTQNTTST